MPNHAVFVQASAHGGLNRLTFSLTRDEVAQILDEKPHVKRAYLAQVRGRWGVWELWFAWVGGGGLGGGCGRGWVGIRMSAMDDSVTINQPINPPTIPNRFRWAPT